MSLIFNVSQLLKSDVGQTRSYEFSSETPINLDDAVVTGVQGQVNGGGRPPLAIVRRAGGEADPPQADASLRFTVGKDHAPVSW